MTRILAPMFFISFIPTDVMSIFGSTGSADDSEISTGLNESNKKHGGKNSVNLERC